MNKEKVEFYFRKLMKEGLGFDLSDPNLAETPKRVAKMYCDEFFKGVGEGFLDFKSFPNSMGYNQIIMLDRIFFISVCAHHFLPFTGHAWILYIPKDKLVGGSKPARLVDHYASRPQIQEQLCHEVIKVFDEEVQPQGTMVMMRAVHECMKCRGVKQYSGAGMMTSVVSGAFAKDSAMELKGLEMVKISLMEEK